jgi:membrane-associated phospholipid phosphatase
MERKHDHRCPAPHVGTVSRRAALRGIGGAGIATAVGIAAHGRAGAAEASAGASQIEPTAGSWKTWVLPAGDRLRPAPPPDAKATAAEMADLRALAAQRDAAALDRASYWDAGAPGYRWNELAIAHAVDNGVVLPAYRMLALLNVAIYDATVAAWDAKYTYDRPRPGVADGSLATAIPTPASPSYPCEHAVAAGAAAAVLGYLFPDAAARFADLATEASQSRLLAGVAYPSDAAAGLALGRQVADLVIARAREDGSDLPWTGKAPVGPGMWWGEPAFPTMGTWKTWVLADGSALRPPPPPAWDSPERAAEIAEVKDYPRDAHPFTELLFWPLHPAGRPAPDSVPFSSNQVVFYYAPVLHLLWNPELNQKLFEYRLDTNPPRAARAYALVGVACYEATVACWDAKFFYWTARPNQFDSTIETVLPTYPIPDYPSGHATTLGGTAEVLSYLFPRDATFFRSRAEENAASRMWAGIHFRSACESGLKLGRDVGQAVIDRAKQDGAD